MLAVKKKDMNQNPANCSGALWGKTRPPLEEEESICDKDSADKNKDMTHNTANCCGALWGKAQPPLKEESICDKDSADKKVDSENCVLTSDPNELRTLLWTVQQPPIVKSGDDRLKMGKAKDEEGMPSSSASFQHFVNNHRRNVLEYEVQWHIMQAKDALLDFRKTHRILKEVRKFKMAKAQPEANVAVFIEVAEFFEKLTRPLRGEASASLSSIDESSDEENSESIDDILNFLENKPVYRESMLRIGSMVKENKDALQKNCFIQAKDKDETTNKNKKLVDEMTCVPLLRPGNRKYIVADKKEKEDKEKNKKQ
ncbi:hypothetical protein C0J52_01429 [Blattella germanica]|nr:hypothetical protein C0J52_01429 [Blattella germanica]